VFIVRMVISELAELIQTRENDPEKIMKIMHDAVGTDFKPSAIILGEGAQVIADQSDALVDAMYYMYNAASKKGINLDMVFKIVHQANMNKKWKDNKFHRREDGKIMKPTGWTEPDIVKEIIRQNDQGSW
jgi:predicted HAD superfamily Cof-like phosphohydrolase